jgi:hypothetical protein
MTAAVGARNLFKFDAGVVHALMQARYQNSSRGQFISEDPIFLGDPRQQVLTDPQSLNTPWATHSASNLASAAGLNGYAQSRGNSTSGWSDAWLRNPQAQNAYGYARDNPITMSDPSGLWGVFATGNVGGDAGLGEGFSGSLQSGVGFTMGNSWSSLVDFGAYSSYGGLVGGPFQSVTLEGAKGIKDSNHAVFGLAGGVSAGLTFTNATRISQLDGISQGYNLNFGIGSASWSSSNGIWAFSFNLGLKPAASFSTYPAATKTGTVATLSLSAPNAHTACGTLCK